MGGGRAGERTGRGSKAPPSGRPRARRPLPEFPVPLTGSWQHTAASHRAHSAISIASCQARAAGPGRLFLPLSAGAPAPRGPTQPARRAPTCCGRPSAGPALPGTPRGAAGGICSASLACASAAVWTRLQTPHPLQGEQKERGRVWGGSGHRAVHAWGGGELCAAGTQ